MDDQLVDALGRLTMGFLLLVASIALGVAVYNWLFSLPLPVVAVILVVYFVVLAVLYKKAGG
jgi:hypothetical protein